MNISMKGLRREGRGYRAGFALVIGLSLGVMGACSDLLEVDLPASLTDEALEDPSGAVTQLNTIITHFDDAYDNFVWEAFGREDGGEVLLCSGGETWCGHFLYRVDMGQFDEINKGRSFASQLHARLSDEWTPAQVPGHAEYKAIASLYSGAVLSHLGSRLCEIAIDAGTLLTPAQTLDQAETLLSRALSEIGTDFEVPYGISSSARTMAYGLRAQTRWMKGDNAGALDDARQIPSGFEAFVTREGTPDRRNLPYYAGTFVRYQEMVDPIDWWTGPANPVTGQNWPSVIPFTGWTHLGILPDGRAVHADGIPVRTEAGVINAVGVEATAVRDTRVQQIFSETLQGRSDQGFVNARYSGENEDIPLVSWEEMWLIRAEIEAGQAAIDLVNELRTDAGLPLVTYADPGNAQEIKYMIFEERRRALFLEGRFVFTKIKNPDMFWFPRAVGNSRIAGHVIDGGVRWLMPFSEFDLNTNLSRADRATGCAPNEAPIDL